MYEPRGGAILPIALGEAWSAAEGARGTGVPTSLRLTSKAAVLVVCLALLTAGCGCLLEGRAASRAELSLLAPAIAYAPRAFSADSRWYLPTQAEISADLRQLNASGFRSLVTYGASGSLGAVPEMARKLGFDGTIVMGIWNPSSSEEWNNAIAQADFVDGYCLGNEGLAIRYKPRSLAIRMNQLRRISGRPVTTTEPIDSYLSGPHVTWLRNNSDWLFPLAHPVWAGRTSPVEAVDWLLARHDLLVASTRRPVMIKEAGFPSDGDAGYNQHTQLAFFDRLVKTGLSYFHFEAYDQPWKHNGLGNTEIEAHWGLYESNGRPKLIVSWLNRRTQ